MYRAQDRSWSPGPAESVSLALVNGLAPPAFKAHVKTLLTYEEGWKRNPTGVMKTIYEAADKWKLVESVERREGGVNAGGSCRRQTQQQQSSARGTSTRACFSCGDQGHIARDCPKPRAQSVGNNSHDQSRSSGGRHGGRGRGHGGRGRGGRGSNQAETDDGSSTTVSSAAPSAPASSSSNPSMPGRAVYVGGSGASMGSAGADSSQTIGHRQDPCLVALPLLRRWERLRQRIQNLGRGIPSIRSRQCLFRERSLGGS